MRKQKEMVESFHLNHTNFMINLKKSLDELEKDINEAQEIDSICTGEWCRAIERDVDDLANAIYSISEPRWSCAGSSKKIRQMRDRLHDIYARYKSVAGTATH